MAGDQALRPSLLHFSGHWRGAGLEVDWPGLKKVPIWDTSVVQITMPQCQSASTYSTENEILPISYVTRVGKY